MPKLRIPFPSGRVRPFFICQLTHRSFKILRGSSLPAGACRLDSISEEEFESGMSDEALGAWVRARLKSEGARVSRDRLVLALPGIHLTSRVVTVPTQNRIEIEKIVSLQASRFLPYAAEDLVTGFEVVSMEKDGYSRVNLTIAPREIIAKYLNLLGDFGKNPVVITPYAQGLAQLYRRFRPGDDSAVLAVDLEEERAEIAILSGKNLLYSRSAQFQPGDPRWKETLIEQIFQTYEAYRKEIGFERAQTIVLSGAPVVVEEFRPALETQEAFACEVLNYSSDIPLSEHARAAVLSSRGSFTGLVGLGLDRTPEELNFLPRVEKETRKKSLRRAAVFKKAALVFAAIILVAAGVLKQLDNDARRLSTLQSDLTRLEKEAAVFQSIADRLEFLAARDRRGFSALDAFHETCKNMPSGVTLTQFSFDAKTGVSVKGQATDIESVFGFASALEKSKCFKKFSVKIGHATKRKTSAGEHVDFEILCRIEKAPKGRSS